MIMRCRRLLMQFAISVAVAAVVPAAAAGLVEGVSVAATTMADAAASNQTLLPDQGASSSDGINTTAVATHAPTRLSALAGEDATAWADIGHPARARRNGH